MLGFSSNAFSLLAFVFKLVISWPTIPKSGSGIHIQDKSEGSSQHAHIHPIA